ncbi:MAG: Fe-only nitrogenase accessory AnfO family protein [Oscillospiraceae bacterium]|jgi:predicted Fe-Mo cluster-binding NifX family protein
MSEFKIAVYLHDLNKLVSFYESNSMCIYTLEENAWKASVTFTYNKVSTGSMEELRKQASEITKLISGCNVIAGSELSGIAYSVFDIAGFHIFTIESISDETFNGIVSDIEQGDIKERMKDEIIKNACPIETAEPGKYFLDLIMLQTECPEVSSKKAMTAFFETTPFLELKLICKHIPPWIENSGKYDIKSEHHSGSFTAVITKKQCGL